MALEISDNDIRDMVEGAPPPGGLEYSKVLQYLARKVVGDMSEKKNMVAAIRHLREMLQGLVDLRQGDHTNTCHCPYCTGEHALHNTCGYVEKSDG